MSEAQLTKDHRDISQHVCSWKWEIFLTIALWQRPATRKLLPNLLALSFVQRVSQATAVWTSRQISLWQQQLGVWPREKLLRQHPMSLMEMQQGLAMVESHLLCPLFLTCMMQRKLLIHEEGVKANKIIRGWTCFHGSGPMSAPGWAPGLLVTIFTAWGWHPDLSQKPGWGLPGRHNSRENVLINSRAY